MAQEARSFGSFVKAAPTKERNVAPARKPLKSAGLSIVFNLCIDFVPVGNVSYAPLKTF